MIAIILAGGYAKRLWPLTKEMPKPLLPLGGRPIIDYIMDKIREIDEIRRVIVSINLRFKNLFEKWAGNYPEGYVELVPDPSRCEEEKPGALKALAEIASEIDDDCLVVAGDNFFTSSLREVISEFRVRDSVIIALYDVKDLEKVKRLSMARIKSDGKVIDFVEKPEEPDCTLVGTGIYVIPRRVLPRLRECVGSGVERDNLGAFIEWLHRLEPVYGYVLGGEWWDIGTRESYRRLLDKVERTSRVNA